MNFVQKMNMKNTLSFVGSLCGQVFFVMLVSACQFGGGRTVVHPTPENIPEVLDPRFVLNEGSEDSVVKINNDFSRFDGITIGKREGNANEMLGWIVDLEVHDGSIYVLDRAYSEVKVFDYEGNLIEKIGREGAGPGEFSFVHGMDLFEEGKEVAVLDAPARVQIFQKSDSGFEYRESFVGSSPASSQGFCVLGDYIYVLGNSGNESELDGVVKKYARTGELVLSFGEKYRFDKKAVVQTMTERGSIACNRESGIIAYASNYIPVLYGYTETGEVKWKVKLGDFESKQVEQSVSDKGRTRISFPLGKTGQSSGILFFSDEITGSFIVKYVEKIKGGWTRHYYRLDAGSGLGEYLTPSVGALSREKFSEIFHITSLDEEYVYVRRSTPFPQIKIIDRSLVFPSLD